MIKRRSDIALCVAMFLVIVTPLLPFLPDWAVDFLGGKEKVRFITLIIFIIAVILTIPSTIAKSKDVAARVRVAEGLVGNNGAEKKKLMRGIARVFMQKMEALWQVILKILISGFLCVVGAVGLILFTLLFLVMFDESAEYWAKTALGILGTDSKKNTIEFIGWGIAGILGFFGAVAINRRANAQVKGYIQERFKAAVEHLGSVYETARVASFYEFYHLARDNKDLRESIFDILCAHLRQVTTSDKYEPKIKFKTNRENFEGIKPTEEVRSLLDVLFQRKDSQGRFIFVKFQSDLRGVFLVGANLWGANFQKANLQEANLQKVIFRWVNFQEAKFEGADLRRANLWGANLQEADLFRADLDGVNFRRADLRGADLRATDLQRVKNLETAKLSGAKIGRSQLPEGFTRPEDVDND